MKKFTLFLGLLLLSGCSTSTLHTSQDGPPHIHVDLSKIHNAVPKELPFSRYGNPPRYTVDGKTYYVRRTYLGYNKRGIASWYGTKFHGQRTSSGELYNMFAMTAASRTLPIPCFAQVTNLQNGRSIIVKVNDRGPFRDNRIMDLSWAAAAKLGMMPRGTALVDVRTIDPRTWHGNSAPQRLVPHLEERGHPHLYLQVGAYASHENAERMLTQLRHDTASAGRIVTINERGRELYRVQLGPLANIEASDALFKRLRQVGFKEPVTVVK